MTTVAPREGVVYGLSCTCHPEDGIRYVGQTVHGADRRLAQHITGATKVRNARVPSARWIKKHGGGNIRTQVLARGLQGENLDRLEVEMIEQFNTYKAGLNCTIGGNGAGREAINNGRPAAFGENHSQARLKKHEVESIWKNHLVGARTPHEEAESYGVDVGTIQAIIRGDSWTSVTGLTEKIRTGSKPKLKNPDENILAGYAMYADGFSMKESAERNGISESFLYNSIAGRTSKHLRLKDIRRGRSEAGINRCARKNSTVLT